MQCRTHPTTMALDTCNQCGDWLCEECTVDVQGRKFCRRCLMSMATPGTPHTKEIAMPGMRRISFGLLFLFTIPPFPSGVNYMYMGLIKRGLAALCGFFLLIYLIGVSSGPLTVLFALAMPVYWLTIAFDGFSIRRRINAGEHVADSIDEAVRFLKNNKYVVWILLALVGLSILGTVVGIIMRLVAWLLPVIVIALGLYVLFKRKDPPSTPPQ